MRVRFWNSHAVEKPGVFSRAILIYTMALGISFTEEELAIIEQRSLYDRLIFTPPRHPIWRLPDGEDPPSLFLSNLVEMHQAGVLAAVGYFADDGQAALHELRLRKALADLKTILAAPRRPYDEFDL